MSIFVPTKLGPDGFPRMNLNGLILEMKDGTTYGAVLHPVVNSGRRLHWMKGVPIDEFTGYEIFIQTQDSKHYISMKVLPNIETKMNFNPALHVPEIAFINLQCGRVRAQGFEKFDTTKEFYGHWLSNHIYVTVLRTKLVFFAKLKDDFDDTLVDFPVEVYENWPKKLIPSLM